MKAYFFPVGPKKRASARYRVYNVVEAKKEFFLGEIHRGNWREADVLVFQRTLSGDYLRAANEARQAGKLVILDVTDFYHHWYKWGLQKPVQRMAKVVHVLTAGNKDDVWLMKKKFNKPAYLVRNAQPSSRHRKKHSKVAVPTIGWIGQESRMLLTLGEIWPVLERLSREGIKFRVVVINNSGSTRGLRLPNGNEVRGKKWQMDKVDRMVCQWDLGVCPQIRQPNGRYHKEENKAVTCWRCGVPCVTFDRTKSWYGDIKRLLVDHRYRRQQGEKGPQRAKAWSPQAVSESWLKIMRRHKK